MKISTFIRISETVHGEHSEYGSVLFRGMMHPVSVDCPEHGPFEVTPNAHINHKVGCSKCLMEPKQDPEKDIYVMSAETFDELFNSES